MHWGSPKMTFDARTYLMNWLFMAEYCSVLIFLRLNANDKKLRVFRNTFTAFGVSLLGGLDSVPESLYLSFATSIVLFILSIDFRQSIFGFQINIKETRV